MPSELVKSTVETSPSADSVSPESSAWLIASDIDGTLAPFGRPLSPAVREAVREVIEAGHHVVLASGRSVAAMRDIANELGLVKGWMVCSNGSVTVRLDPELPDGMQVTEVIKFDPEPALRLLTERLPGARFAVEDVGLGFRANSMFPDGELWGGAHVVALHELWEQEVTRIVVRGGDEATPEFRDIVTHLGLNDVSYAVGFNDWLDIAPKGVNKASAVEAAREKLGIPADRTFAIGDGFNDIEMLQWAARSVAMGNADPNVQAAAKYVTDTVDEDGAAKALRQLLPLKH